MYVATVQVGPSTAEALARFHLGAGGARTGQTLGIVASFGPRSASLANLAATVAQPTKAETNLINANEVRGCVAIVHRGGGVPLVEKSRRCMQAGARAVLIVNSDDEPLLADSHHSDTGATDAGDDITVPVLVVPRSASTLLHSDGLAVSLNYNTASATPLTVDGYASALQAAAQEQVPEGVPRSHGDVAAASTTVPGLDSVSHHGDSWATSRQMPHSYGQVQEQWTAEQLKDARQRAEAELSELRWKLGSDESSNSSVIANRTGYVGGQLVGGPAVTTSPAVTADASSPVPMSIPAYQMHSSGVGSSPAVHSLREHGNAASPDVEALRSLVSAEAELELQDMRTKLGAAQQQLFATKTELASVKNETLSVMRECDDERKRVQGLQLQLETASISQQVASADLEANREQQKARATEAIENAARLQRSQASLSAETARRRSSEAALEEALALNRELQAEKTAMNQALLSAQESAVKMEQTRAHSDARSDERLAAAQQAAVVAEAARRDAEATLERLRSDFGARMAAATNASKVAMEDVRRMQKEDEQRLAAALDTIVELEDAAAKRIQQQRELEQSRDAIAIAAKAASDDASAAIEAQEKQRKKDAEQATIQLAAAQAESQNFKAACTEIKGEMQAAESALVAQEQREAMLTAELQAARAASDAAMESAKYETQAQQEAAQLAQVQSREVHEVELEALRKSADDALAMKVSALQANAARNLSSALQESQARHELALREQQGEHELAVRVVRVEVETEVKASTEAEASATAERIASEHKQQLNELRAEAAAQREDAKAQMEGLQRVKAEEMERLMRAESEELELVRQRARDELAESARREAETVGRLQTALSAERTTHHRCAAKVTALEQSILDHEKKAMATVQEINNARSRLTAAEQDVADAQKTTRQAQSEVAAAQQRQALVEAAADERDRLSEQRVRTAKERIIELEDQLRELISATQEQTRRDAATKAEMKSFRESKDAEMTEMEKELERTKKALATLQVESDQKVQSLEHAAAAGMEQALENAAQRSKREELALRNKYEAQIQQDQVSQRTAAELFMVEKAALADRAERAEERVHAMEGQLRSTETQLAELRDTCERTKSALTTALESERRTSQDADQIRTELSTANNSLLRVQVEAQMQLNTAEHEWATRAQKAESEAAEMTKRCRVAEEIASGEAKAHAALLGRLSTASPVMRSAGAEWYRMVGQSEAGGTMAPGLSLDRSTESNLIAPASPSRPFGGFE